MSEIVHLKRPAPLFRGQKGLDPVLRDTSVPECIYIQDARRAALRRLRQRGAQPKLLYSLEEPVHISKIFQYEVNATGLPDKYDMLDDSLEEDVPHGAGEEGLLPTAIEGPPELQERIKALLLEYKEVFREEVSPVPADVPPMEIHADTTRWRSMKNSGPPRVQTPEKNDALRDMCQRMTELKVVEPCNAAHYSQAHLVPKGDPANKKFRVTIDFRMLNECTQPAGWRPPIIPERFERIGRANPKFFAVMDQTSGYHQCPLHVDSRWLTAFITFGGVFQYLRVAQGLKGAPSYFQFTMVTRVLVGLVFIICENYLDDVITYGKTPDEFIERLTLILERFRKHRLYLNPKKCRFGMSEIEYLGHRMNSEGLTFSREKIEKVLNFPLPRTGTDLKSFIGVISYMRDNLQDHTTVVKPLLDLARAFEKSAVVQWNTEAVAAFDEVRKRVNEMPTMFFLDDTSPIFLETDASDYGIGGYCYQMVEGVKRPVAFMSSSLTAQEINWTTIEKECYAIVASLRKFEYLLRDRHFTLLTDHKNLIYVNDPPSPKVRRWKLGIQEFDFVVKHVRGKDNVVADAFSRLLPVETEIISMLAPIELDHSTSVMIEAVHNSVCGHHGVERTIKLLDSKDQTWPNRRAHVKRFIHACPCCQKMSYLKKPILTRPFKLAAKSPMQRIYIDTLSVGNVDVEGNEHLLVIVDAFSRYVDAIPIADLTARTAARKLLIYIARYGAPDQITSDNGSQFVNDIIEQLFDLTEIEHIRTIPHSSEQNGMVERANKEILRHLRATIFDREIRDDWSLALPFVLRIMNSTPTQGTGVAPAELLFGNSIDLNRGIIPIQHTHKGDPHNLREYTSNLIRFQQATLRVAEACQAQIDAEHAAALATATPHTYQENDLILCEYPDQKVRRGAPNKLAPILQGPLQIIRIDGDRIDVVDLITGKSSTVHVSRIRPFIVPPTGEIMPPTVIARRDHNEFHVERILEHKGDVKRPSSLSFHVLWSGYPLSEATWQPWKDVRDCDALHRYLFACGLKALIPKEHKHVADKWVLAPRKRRKSADP